MREDGYGGEGDMGGRGLASSWGNYNRDG